MWFPRKYNTPVRMRGPELPVREITLQRGRREQDYSEDVLLPRRITGHEAIGQLFEYRIEAVRSVPHPEWFATDEFEVDLDAIKGSAITLTFKDVFTTSRHWREPHDRERTGIREITGIVADAEVLGTEGDNVVYEFVLRPIWWCATLRKNSRIFIENSICDILHTILKSYSHDIKFRIENTPSPRRDFIRQASETDWNFCMRLCEEFGFLIWFEHSKGRHFLVIADSIRACKAQTAPYATLPYRPNGGYLDREYVTHLSWRTSVALNRVVVHDHSYISPRLSANSAPYREEYGIKHGNSHPDIFDSERIESYEPAEYAQPETTRYHSKPVDSPGPEEAKAWRKEAQHLARVKLEAARCGRIRAKGQGALRGIESGRTFTLTDHPHAGANGEYLVLDCRIDIRGTQGLSSKLDGGVAEYEFDAQFELHPTREPYRMPQVTPRPRIEGYENAVIVGWEQHPIMVDAYNRVRIQYAWDREGNYHGNTSIWVRLALPWQGDQMGVVMHGRPGQEVLVAYVNGDPDRPIVAAFVSNQDNMPPWKLPANRALTGIVSRTLGNGNTSNHLVLDDTENRQQAQLASDHAKSSLSLGYITRIEGNEGRQEGRGEGFELQSEKQGVLRALGMLLTTIVKLGAAGKMKEMGETIARLTRARDIHKSMARQAQRHGAQDAGSDQSSVTASMRRDNAELRGKPAAGAHPGVDDFPEFEAPHLTLSSAAGIQTAAAGSTHIASDEHTAMTTGGHVSIATGKSFLASVRETISLYAQKALSFVTPGPVRIESRTDSMTQSSQKDMTITSTQGIVEITGKNGVDIRCGGTLLRMRPEGLTIYTDGKFLVHAGDHATDDPQARPVDFPVTPDNPGKYAAHHVLVEDGGGFAVANQPYRLTLDDGQIIEGVTSELGELQMVTSNTISFGVVELMSQSSPDDVIGVTHVTVYDDASRSVTPPSEPPAKRTTTIGGKSASTPDENVTSQAKQPEYFTCDALNFGLRRYRLLKGATAEDTPLKYQRRDNIEYPVAKTYTAAIKTALEAIDWVGLDKGPSNVFYETIVSAIQPSLWAALQDGPFGLRAGSEERYGAMPEVVIVGPEGYPKYGMKADYAGGFVSEYWTIAINTTRVDRIVSYAKPLDDKSLTGKALDTARRNLSETLRDIADTLYHESRHCQQRYWMISLFHSYPGDYANFRGLGICYQNTVNDNALTIASGTKFPADELAKIGMHRMLVFDYYWRICGKTTKANPKLAPILKDLEIVEQEVCKLRNVTPEVAKLMVDEKKGYRSQLHEEDAWTCGEIVTSYWRDPDGKFRVNPGACTKQYGDTVTAIGGKPNA
ncbi:type VI secretion system tip protein TssI/VgrG [Paraburkholderia sp. A3BS-1L]|uniref:type VI secretion system Vgr family protein n=1 Tax=Paraburkholderia sp. A3BS-1L TaxID=3028375 RepID=UPI003DA7D224